MAYRATRVSDNPLDYFLEHRADGPLMHISDVMLRENKNPKEVFAHAIRIATGSKWSHSAICYLLSDPKRGYGNTFLIEAKTKGVRIASWRDEVVPFEQFTVGIKRLKLDWYKETPYEQARRNPHDPKDVYGIEYLHHVRGIAFDQINGLYDHKTVIEIAALYARRAAKRHLSRVPQIAGTADIITNLMKKWDEAETSELDDLRFICSGLVQYSFFEALRLQIVNALEVPEHKEIALQNLNNMQRVIFRDDPDYLIADYIQQVQTGKLDIHDPAPADVLDLLKTATPADFNNSPNLAWQYIILKGIVWRIEEVPEGYQAQGEGEEELLKMLSPEHRSSDDDEEV